MLEIDDDWANCTCGLFEDTRSITKAGTCSYCLKRRDKENIEMGKIFGKESVHDISEERFKERLAEERILGAIKAYEILLKLNIGNCQTHDWLRTRIKLMKELGK